MLVGQARAAAGRHACVNSFITTRRRQRQSSEGMLAGRMDEAVKVLAG